MSAAVRTIHLPGHEPCANLVIEEQLFAEVRSKPTPACLFYVNEPCIVLGRSNVPEDWVNLEAAWADGLPILRRFSGGGAVYHDLSNLNFSLLMPKTLLDGPGAASTGSGLSRYVDLLRGVVLRALSRGMAGFEARGVSDIVLNGRKVSGSAQRIAASAVLHHGTVMLKCPHEAIERYLKVPPNRPGVPHRGFVTGLAEEGWPHAEEALMLWLAEEFEAAVADLAR